MSNNYNYNQQIKLLVLWLDTEKYKIVLDYEVFGFDVHL